MRTVTVVRLAREAPPHMFSSPLPTPEPRELVAAADFWVGPPSCALLRTSSEA